MIEHQLVPKHEVLSAEDAEKILEKYNCEREHLPKILIDDPAIKDMTVAQGDIIMITRKSPHAGISYFYRVVI